MSRRGVSTKYMNKIKSIVLFYNSQKKETFKFAQFVDKTLRTKRIKVFKICVNKDKFKPIQANAAISVGGDGTVLFAARHIVQMGMPLLGINAGGLGFLSSFEMEEFKKHINPFLKGRFNKICRKLLSVEVIRHGKRVFGPAPALNDCVVRTTEARAFHIKAGFENELLTQYFGDGIIISTPTGSTAYNLAVLGPIASPELDIVLISPICPHTLTHRPIILSSDKTIKLSIVKENKIPHRVSLCIDGQENFDLKILDEVVIKKYPKDLLMLVPSGFSHFNILRKKLKWGER